MLVDLSVEANKVGLTTYLGRQACFNEFHDTGIRHRMDKGWAAFGKYKDELCGRHYPLRSRLRLFDAVVSATVLYGSGTWTMTVERTHLLQTTLRKMLRKIVGTPRRYLSDSPGDNVVETWFEWIGRATAIAEKEAKKAGMDTWVEA